MDQHGLLLRLCAAATMMRRAAALIKPVNEEFSSELLADSEKCLSAVVEILHPEEGK